MVCITSLIAALMLSVSPACLVDVEVSDFESEQVGEFPGGSWVDIQERVVINPLPAPTMLVIDTTDADGNPTRAAQSKVGIGTNGMFVPIDDAPAHRFEIDIRVDSPIRNRSFAVAAGFLKDIGRGDVNLNTQVVVYTWSDRRMYLFVTQGNDIPGTVNLPMQGFRYDIDTWYRVAIEADARNGVIIATVIDSETGEQLSTRTHNATQWNVERGRFDAYGVFDGEAIATTTGMQVTVDDVKYEPVFNCIIDFTADGVLDFFDVSAFLTAYSSQDPAADFSGDGQFSFFDISIFLGLYSTGCP